MPATPMAAVTVIANPLAENHDKVLLFQSGEKTSSLRVEPRNIVDLDIKVSLGSIDAASVGRPLTSPSQLTSMVYKDTVAVYGITGKDETDLQLTMLSPVQHKIKVPKPVAGVLAGCAQPKGETGWLYMLVQEDGVTKIGEWELSSKAVNLRTLSCELLSTSTQLHAVFDPVLETRWVVYQNTNNEIVVFDAKRDKGFIVNESDKVAAKTPLALAIVPDPSDKAKRRLVTYFISTEKKKKVLCFANSSLKTQDLSWEDADERPRAVPGANVLLSWAQIDTYVDVPRQRTLIFGLSTKTEDEEAVFNAITHSWSSLEQ